MRRNAAMAVRSVLAIAVLGVGRAAGGEYFPPPEAQGSWRALVRPNQAATTAEQQAVREKAGLDWSKLKEAQDYCASFGVPSHLLVIRHGWVAAEWHSFAEPRGIASCTKSLTALAIARLFDLSDAGKLPRRIGPDDEAWRFLPPEWADAEPARKAIRLRHMLTMTSGLTPYDGPYGGDYLQKLFAQKVEAPAGTVWAYASVPVDMLSLIIENATGLKEDAFFNREINAAIGAAPVKWGQFAGHTGGSGGPEGGARFPARDLARVGYLVLHDGAWEKDGQRQQVISAARIRDFTRAAPFLEKTTWRQPNFAWERNANRYYGHLWWTNRTGEMLGEDVPRDALLMAGWGKQACFVVPSLDMVVVRLGPDRELNDHPEYFPELWKRLMAAVTDAPAAAPVQKAERWDTRELAFTADRDYANPFRDVALVATFTHAASGRKVMVNGFYDGGRTWRLRFMPAELGEWAYVTQSANPGLDGKTGRVTCVAPTRPFLHGPLRADGHHFVHADGTRRFLISTRLSCQSAAPTVRQRAIRFLKEHGVNRIVFMMVGVHGTAKDLYGSGPDFDRYGVERFQAIDAFIDEMRREDVLVSPYFYYFNDKVQRKLTPEQDRAFLRYGMARFGAYANVMPVLANEVEQKLTERKDAAYDLRSHAWANRVGPYLKELAVFGQAVAVHNPMETDIAVRPGFYTLLRDWPFPWANCMLRQAQVGSLGALPELNDDVPEHKKPTYNDRAYARHNQLLADVRRFRMPVVNEEPGYEMGGYSWDSKKQDPRPWNSQTPDTLLATFWTAACAGGYVLWGNLSTYELGDPLPRMEKSATLGLLRVLAGVMSRVPYWEMAPANEAVNPAPRLLDGMDWRTNFALGRPGRIYLIYSRYGGGVDVQAGEGRWRALRVDPRTGRETPLGEFAGPLVRVLCPKDAESVVVLTRPDPATR